MAKIEIPPSVVKSVYTSNWGDIFGYPLARFLLNGVVQIPFLTPNVISILAFIFYVLGCIFIFTDFPNHNYWAAFLLPLGFVLDDLDGQVARARQLSSPIGNYLDKVLDVLKIFILTASLGYAAYVRTDNVLYIFLAFAACFFFNYRYYIKLETMFSQIDRDATYLEKSTAKQKEFVAELNERDAQLKKSFWGQLQLFWLKHRMIFYVDEAEFAILTAVFLLFDRVEWVVWVLAIGQVVNALIRVFQRGYQTQWDREKLLLPIRK